MMQHIRLSLRNQPRRSAGRSYGAAAASLACALVVSGLSTATLVLVFAIAQVA
jgi:hypothetical protein